MDIQTFLDKMTGDWFSQRTIYQIHANEVDNSKANLTINRLEITDSKVNHLAQQYQLNLDLSLGAIACQWDNSPDWGKPKQQGSIIILIFTSANETNTGKIVRVLNNEQIIEGEYILAEDESLTLSLSQNEQNISERIWFASDNLKLRNTVIKQQEKVIETSFYSEIKRLINNDNK